MSFDVYEVKPGSIIHDGEATVYVIAVLSREDMDDESYVDIYAIWHYNNQLPISHGQLTYNSNTYSPVELDNSHAT